MEKFECKECGFKSWTSIVVHIETEHASLAENAPASYEGNVLALYLSKHNARGSDLCRMSEDDVIRIANVEMPRGPGGLGVPKINPAHHFGGNVREIVADILENRRVLLTGHTGSGKTSMIQQIAARSNYPVVRVNLNGQMPVSDFVGMWTVRGGEMVWCDGILPAAMRSGAWLILDEIDFAEPSILSVLNGVLERDGFLTIQEKGGEKVIPHENFRIFATANSVGCMASFRHLYQGTDVMNEAFIDRWRVYFVDYLPAVEETKILMAATGLSKSLCEKVVKVAGAIRESFSKEEVQCTFSLRRMIDWCEIMRRQGKNGVTNPVISAEAAILNKISPEDSEVVKGIIYRVVNS